MGAFVGINFQITRLAEPMQLEEPRGTPARSASPWAGDDHEQAGVIVLAGGKSKRMGVDKSLLPFRGKPLIQHVCDQVRPYFDELLIAGGDETQLAFLKAHIVPDKASGQGPLRGIASALEAARYDLNFVIACDIPWVNFVLLKRLLQEAFDCDCVVPVTAEGNYEPLFSVYRKSALPGMLRVLEEDKRRIVAAYRHCRVKSVLMTESYAIQNINTLTEYTALANATRPDLTDSEQRNLSLP